MKIALIGNQNSGKTTLFNLLTGMQQKVGNWPGVTIEKKVGIIRGTKHELIDLPGIYSLSPYTAEERISKEFILKEKPDLIINIVDATNLERNLYLTSELLELDIPIIIALNMIDLLEKKGIKINDRKLSEQLGTEVYRISARKGTGIKNLLSGIYTIDVKVRKHIFHKELEEKISRVQDSYFQGQKNKRFLAIKLLEECDENENREVSLIRKQIEKEYGEDIDEIIATQRYEYLDSIMQNTLIKKKRNSITDILDAIFLNKYLAFPIFAFIMCFIYYISVGVVGNIAVDFVANIISELKLILQNIFYASNVSAWINSLVIDGIVEGVGTVCEFVPQLAILFLCISFLESSGYMSRIAFLLDKSFRKLGLNGKSLIPFIVGSGCSVPGIMATRIIERNEEREKTIIFTPFIPCSAKLPMIALFSGYFFPDNAGLVSASFYFLSIIIIIISALIMKKDYRKNSYISELPDYQFPSLKYILKDVIDKVTAFLKRAGSVILICSIVIWFLLSFSPSLKYDVDIEESILAQIGKCISWIFYPILGENSWGASVSILQGLIAKEQVISSMSIIAGLGGEIENMFSNGGAFSFFNYASAYAFVAFNLFSAPCFAAITAMGKELGSKRKLIGALLFQTLIAYGIAFIIFQVGSRVI